MSERSEESAMPKTGSFDLSTVPGIHIESGHVDLFALGDDGRRWPLLRAAGPITLVGLAADAPVVGEAREGVEVVALSQAPTSNDLAQLATAMNAQLHMGELTDAEPQTLAAALAAYADSEVRRQLKVREDLVTSLLSVDARINATAVDVIQGDVKDPERAAGHSRRFPSDFEEVNILRVVGDAAGFTLKDPRFLPRRGRVALIEVAQESGLRTRMVSLSTDWTSDLTSPMVGFLKTPESDAQMVALIPRRGKVYYRTAMDATMHRVVEGTTPLGPQALMVYPGFPLDRKASFADMGRLALRGSGATIALILGCSFLVAVLGLATPALTNAVLGTFVPQGNIRNVIGVGVALTLLAISAGAFVVVQNFATARMTQIAQMRVEAALWDRTLRLPLKFFREYPSGALAYRIIAVDTLKQLLSSQTVTALLAAVFSLVNFVLLFRYSTTLALAALAIFVITALFMMWLTRQMSAIIRAANSSQQAATAWFVQLVSGISKIRVAGAERRFTDISLLKQADQIANQASQTMLTGKLQTYLALVATLSTMVFFLIIGVFTWEAGPTISAATYIAFSTAFGAVLGAIVGVSSAMPAVAAAGPILSLVRPILDAEPAEDPDAQALTRLRGDYEFRSVTFRYLEELPLILNGLSCRIEAGKTTAIVGPSGSGKTTALRLLSALEYPDSGQLLIDGHDVRSIDAGQMRKRLGVVVQGGQINNASILDNIGGGADIDEDMAWVVAEQANIADDIKAMPMKMNTVVSPMTLSGGQAQRLLIARALARRPDILLLDEATSALDNVSQASVTRALDQMPGTKVIVAQRLSTLEAVDHILVMDRGTLVQQGTYADLMAQEGVFAELAKRQLAGT